VAFSIVSLLILALGMTATYLAAKFSFSTINPISVYAFVWTIAIFLYYVKVGTLQPLRPATVLMLELGTVFFVAGYMLSSVNSGRAAKAVPRIYDEARLRVAYRVGLGALAFYLIIQTSRLLPFLGAAGGLQGVLTGNGKSFRRAYLSASIQLDSASLGNSGVFLALFGYALFLGSLTLVWAGYYASTGRFKLALQPLMLMAGYSLISLQRASFTYSLLIFASSWYLHAMRMRIRPAPNRSRRLPLGAVALLIVLSTVVILVPLSLRSLSSTSDDRQAGVSDYVISGLVGLNSLVRVDPTLAVAVTGEASPFPVPRYAGPLPGQGYGAFTFQGLASILDRLGLPVDAPPASYDFVQSDSSSYGFSNTYTYLLFFYNDFGLTGIAIGALLLAFGASRMQRLALAGHIAAVTAASVLLTTIAMSWFGISLLQDARYLFICLIAPFVTRHITRAPDQGGDQHDGASVSPNPQRIGA
jgi:oligosaccharide repeat unit polymerase